MSNPAFCSPNDPIAGLDSGRNDHWMSSRNFSLVSGIRLSLKSCTRITQGPRQIHGLEVHQGNRLDRDLELGIGGEDWKIFVGRSLAMASSSSPLAELENNTYARFGVSYRGYSLYFSNDVLEPFNNNDHGYTGTLGAEFPLSGNISLGDIRLDSGRLRIGGTTGIPNRAGPIIERDGRKFYGDVNFEEAAAGFAALEVSGTFGSANPTPFTLSVTLMNDDIRAWGQGEIHRHPLIDSPEFQRVKDERGLFLLFEMNR